MCSCVDTTKRGRGAVKKALRPFAIRGRNAADVRARISPRTHQRAPTHGQPTAVCLRPMGGGNYLVNNHLPCVLSKIIRTKVQQFAQFAKFFC